MTFWIIVFIIVGIIACIIDDGNFLSKLSLAMVASLIAFWMLRWITGMEFMATLAKISGTVIVFSVLTNIILVIFSNNK